MSEQISPCTYLLAAYLIVLGSVAWYSKRRRGHRGVENKNPEPTGLPRGYLPPERSQKSE